MAAPSTAKAKPGTAETDAEAELYLPQYGFGSVYNFDELVEHNRFLFRVHTPHPNRSRASSPSGRPSSPNTSANVSRNTSRHRATLSRSPSSLSTSVSSLRSGHSSQDEDAASSDPYFLSRRFKDDLGSPDPGVRRRTLSTLSTMSSGTYIGSDYDYDESDAETAVSSMGFSRSLGRSTSMSRVPLYGAVFQPMHRRAHSAEFINTRSPPPKIPIRSQTNAGSGTGDTDMTYEDLVRHLDWTTRSSSPYVTTSFSFFWCLWEAVRRYKLAVKHDVEIAVIDARKVVGRAKTALQVLRSVEGGKQDKSYWKWYRFALESQDVLVFGAIPGDAIFASIPLTQILPKLPSYCFKESIPKAINAPLESGEEDPREPSTRRTSSSTQHSIVHHHEHQTQDPAFSSAIFSTLSWDIGTSIKPQRHSSSRSQKQLSPTTYTTPSRKSHTSHKEFCQVLTNAFLAPERDHAARLVDATAAAVKLAECLVEPWFRARCAIGAGYPFHHSDDEGEEEHVCGDSDCIGLAGDGCALKKSKSKSSLVDRSESQDEAAQILADLALVISRWPAGWWYSEHAGEVEGVLNAVVDVCVREAAKGVHIRLDKELERTLGSAPADSSAEVESEKEEERRGRGEKRILKSSMKAKHAIGGSPKPFPSKGTPSGTPSKPRARSPLGLHVSRADSSPSPSPFISVTAATSSATEAAAGSSLAPPAEIKTKAELEKERKLRREASEDSLSSKSTKSTRSRLSRLGKKASNLLSRSKSYSHSTPSTPESKMSSASASPAQAQGGASSTQGGGSQRIKWSENLSTPPPTPPRRTVSVSLSSGRKSPPPLQPRRKRLSFPGLGSGKKDALKAQAQVREQKAQTLGADVLPTPRTSPASSIRATNSLTLTAAAVTPELSARNSTSKKHSGVKIPPGGWPGSDSEAEAEEGEHHEDDRGDVIVRRPRRRRPMSWAGSALGAIVAGVAVVEGSKKVASTASEAGHVGASGSGEKDGLLGVPQPRLRTRTLSHGALKESALQEMVENVLKDKRSDSSLRGEVKVESSSPSPAASPLPLPAELSEVKEDGRLVEVKSRTDETLEEEKPHSEETIAEARRETLRRLEKRVSSNSLDRSELSPVREDPAEDEEQVSEEAEQPAAGTNEVVVDAPIEEPDLVVSPIEISDDHMKDRIVLPPLDLSMMPASLPTPSPSTAPDEEDRSPLTAVPSAQQNLPVSRGSPKHERSHTLESIPEEELFATSPLRALPKVSDSVTVETSDDKPVEGGNDEQREVPDTADANFSTPLIEIENEKGIQSAAESVSGLVPMSTSVAAPALKRDASVWTEEEYDAQELIDTVADIQQSKSEKAVSTEPEANVRVQNEKLYNALLKGTSKSETKTEPESEESQGTTMVKGPLPLIRTAPPLPIPISWIRCRLSHFSQSMSFALTGSPVSASPSSTSAASPVFEDDYSGRGLSGVSMLRASSWAASCFVCGVIVTAFIVSDRRACMTIGNRYN